MLLESRTSVSDHDGPVHPRANVTEDVHDRPHENSPDFSDTVSHLRHDHDISNLSLGIEAPSQGLSPQHILGSSPSSWLNIINGDVTGQQVAETLLQLRNRQAPDASVVSHIIAMDHTAIPTLLAADNAEKNGVDLSYNADLYNYDTGNFSPFNMSDLIDYEDE
ncbi:hypothetical protein NW762_003083 [Fusarium torreyae]|uniref:Uncharacterized protein n=1 Tax=Fusarium torreyae TaxID=1237075 RepID=A0A9W8SA26_9HYPO|nr:hypothetical protein NW762_003083 [Fusarium torreyae]